MHVRAVVSSGTKASDVELAKLFLFGQVHIMAEVAVVPLVWKKNMIFIIYYISPNKVCPKPY